MIDINRAEELREAIELLFFGYRQFTKGPDRILEKIGLNRVHHRILYFVGRNPDHSVKDLLSVLGISKQALNLPLRQLLSMRLVMSEQSQTDGRVRELRLTTEGKQLEKRLTQTQLKLLDTIFSAADTRSENGWRSVMRQLRSIDQ